MDDAQADSQGTNRAIRSTAAGRSTGNFKIDEDMKFASADWSMIDYTAKAKTEFQITQGKLFKHDIVYDILKRSLPKFEILIETIPPKVARAFALLNNDDERALERDAIRVATKCPVANITALLNSVDKNDSNVLLDKDKQNLVLRMLMHQERQILVFVALFLTLP